MSYQNPALRDFWRTQRRYKVLYGGRGSSKSWDAAIQSVKLSSNYTLKFLCIRQFQNNIRESVYALIVNQIIDCGLRDEYIIQSHRIIHKITGSEFIFFGIARNFEEIKSTENVDILWAEEAHALTKEQWDILNPTIRNEHSEIWLIFNPRYATDYIYKRFIVEGYENSVVRKINYTENPHLSQTLQNVIAEMKRNDPEEHRHVYLGYPKKDSDKSVIKREWIESALLMDLEAIGVKTLGYDVADEGYDDFATVGRHGSVVVECESWDKMDTHGQSTQRAWNIAVSGKYRAINYDSIGVGVGAKVEFEHIMLESTTGLADPIITGVAVSDGATEGTFENTDKLCKDMFLNLKAELWWRLRLRFQRTHEHFTGIKEHSVEEMISLKVVGDGELTEELTSPRFEIGENGRIKMESKKDMKKRGVPSPNLADALILSFAPSDYVDYSSMM